MKNTALEEISKKYPTINLDEVDYAPTPLETICEKLGISITEKYFDNNLFGRIYKKKDEYCIEVNMNNSTITKRFTIAQKLGHIIRHDDMLDNDGEIFNINSEVENEANDFALELLMPKKHFIRKYLQCQEHEKRMIDISKQNIILKIPEKITSNLYRKTTYFTLLEYFKVSLEAIKERLKNLGMAHGC
jgi:Zn-dependent peptidase ImmA (M78 family)